MDFGLKHGDAKCDLRSCRFTYHVFFSEHVDQSRVHYRAFALLTVYGHDGRAQG